VRLDHWSRCVVELLGVELDLVDVGVTSDGPERREIGVLDAMDRIVAPQHRAGGVGSRRR